jgi:hypothetical protein
MLFPGEENLSKKNCFCFQNEGFDLGDVGYDIRNCFWREEQGLFGSEEKRRFGWRTKETNKRLG